MFLETTKRIEARKEDVRAIIRNTDIYIGDQDKLIDKIEMIFDDIIQFDLRDLEKEIYGLIRRPNEDKYDS